MTKIKFQATTLVSLYYLWTESFGKEEKTKPVLEAFQDDRILSIAKARPSEFSYETFSSLRELKTKLNEREIQTFEEFEENIKILFPKDAERMLPVLKNTFEGLSDYVEKKGVKDKIEKTLETLNAEQDRYQNLLNNISVFLGFKTEQNIPCCINIYPDKKFNDGSSSDIGCQLSYSLTSDGGEYVNDTLIPVRKMSVPMHEATHYLFSHSEFRKNLSEEKFSLEIYNSLCEFLEQNPEEKLNSNRSSKQEAVLAIDEALASCSSVLYKEEVNGEKLPKNYDWYYGFESANQLAQRIYPKFREYILAGKQLDNAFFEELDIEELRSAILNASAQKKTQQQKQETPYGVPNGYPSIPQQKGRNLSPLFLAKINGGKQ